MKGIFPSEVTLPSLFATTGRVISPGSENQITELFHLEEEKRRWRFFMWKCTIHMVFLTVKHMRVVRK